MSPYLQHNLAPSTIPLNAYRKAPRRKPAKVHRPPKPAPSSWSFSQLISTAMKICDAYDLPGGSLGDTLQF
jgi:hypothetical protein